MRFADLLGPLSGPECFAVSRRILGGASLAFIVLTAWAAATIWYFLFRDDVAAHLIARQSAMQQAYEERITALKGHLDRLASQNLVDQDGLDRRVSELIARQAQLESRQAILATLSERTLAGAASGAVLETGALVVQPSLPSMTRPEPLPERPKPTPIPDTFGLRLRGDQLDSARDQLQRSSGYQAPLRERIAQLQRSLAAAESTQLQALDRLFSTAETRASHLRGIMREAGLNPDLLGSSGQKPGLGGPFVPVTAGAGAGLFETMAARVQGSIERLAYLDRSVVTLPFGRPVPSDADLTSGFGYRVDPFTRGPAMHTGLDFRAEYGAAVHASGAGQVAAAEYAGGYGNMVEIDHGNGVTTRYAHLSSMAVSPGETVAAGAVIGRAGSTGRSTGAHLHYETRIDGEAVDPQRFLRAGSRLAAAR